jgi:hypothetical protein
MDSINILPILSHGRGSRGKLFPDLLYSTLPPTYKIFLAFLGYSYFILFYFIFWVCILDLRHLSNRISYIALLPSSATSPSTDVLHYSVCKPSRAWASSATLSFVSLGI